MPQQGHRLQLGRLRMGAGNALGAVVAMFLGGYYSMEVPTTSYYYNDPGRSLYSYP